ncbi:carbohydrate binding family 9 domain-containing protein [candidate division KSB1 bacterium]|nr:carbohydrate binding family 9 domain-containing protein [candidate division KSB1 bacterium]
MKYSVSHSMTFIICLFMFNPALSAVQNQNRTQPDSTLNRDKIEIFVHWTDKKIVVDGVLDDKAWNDAEPYEDYFFQHQPLDREPSSEKTRVMVLQDDKMIYFGFQCYDSEPDKIFASSMRRDMNYGSGEVIELLLDTFQDNRNCYAFDTNPLGGKGDAIISDQGNHINKQWDCVINMDGKLNDKGWAAEFAIPFKSLKYKHSEVVDWNINITREIKHRQEETYLVPVPRELGHSAKFRGELFALLHNIRPPEQGLNFEVYPYALTGQTNIYGNEQQKTNEFHSGIDFKYDITPQLALDLTYKTDFAQAEAEEEIVNVTRFNVRREEKREFFLQNAGLFQFGPGQRSQSNFILFDSRTIGIQDRQRIPLLGGGKLTGKAGKYSIAALSLQSEGTALEGGIHQSSTNYTAVRIKRDVSKNSHIGLMTLNQQSTSDQYSRVFGVDGLWNVTQAIRFDASAAKSFSPQTTSTSNDMAGDVGFVLNKKWIDLNIRYTHIDSLFNPQMGFVRRSNIRNTDGNVILTKWFNGKIIDNIAFSSGLLYITDHHQVLQTRNNTFSGSMLLRRGDEISLTITRSYEFVPVDASIRDMTIFAGVYDTWFQSISFDSYRARPVNIDLTFQWGQLFDGKQQSANLTGTAKLSNHLSVDMAYTYNHLDLLNGGLYSHILSTRWAYSFTPDFFTKVYLQWNTADNRFSANFILDYTYRPRSHIYLVYNENQNTLLHEPTDRIIMLKMTWLWQI